MAHPPGRVTIRSEIRGMDGAPDERWNNDRLKSELRQVTGRDFEVVRMDGLVTP